MSVRIRLVKVVVQPYFVYDDGEQLVEIPPEVHEIAPADWPTYSSETFPREVKEWQDRMAEATIVDPGSKTQRKRAARESSSPPKSPPKRRRPAKAA